MPQSPDCCHHTARYFWVEGGEVRPWGHREGQRTDARSECPALWWGGLPPGSGNPDLTEVGGGGGERVNEK